MTPEAFRKKGGQVNREQEHHKHILRLSDEVTELRNRIDLLSKQLADSKRGLHELRSEVHFLNGQLERARGMALEILQKAPLDDKMRPQFSEATPASSAPPAPVGSSSTPCPLRC